ncbi:MAG TPA: hypothetical protein VNO52_05160 [Methylomirabilota bacterium]|nr:hypothetical protein [Methylomirabilota bacterium]
MLPSPVPPSARESRSAIVPAWALAFVLAFGGAGCSRESTAGVTADAPGLSPKEREILQAARQAVGQFENWAHRAEFKYERRDGVWHVTAWRVENPRATGNKRYVPWGSRHMIIDDAGKVLAYGDQR